MKSYILIVFALLTNSLSVLAESVWNDWQTYDFKDYTQNKSKSLRYGYWQDSFSKYEAYGTEQQNAYFEIQLPLRYRMFPLKPFQEVFSISPKTKGTITLTFHVTTDFGEQSYSYECPFSEWSHNHIRFLLTLDIAGCYTIGVDEEYWTGKYSKTLKRFCNVKDIKPISVTIQPNGGTTIAPIGIREMSFNGIEQSALEYARFYIEQENYDMSLSILNRFIDAYANHYSAEAYTLRAIIHEELGNYELAISDASSAIQLSSSSEVAYYIRGVLLIESGDFSGISDLRKSGQRGLTYLREHNLKDGDRLSVTTINMIIPETIRNSLPLSKKTVKLTPNQIYSRCNNSVFVIQNTGLEGTSQGSGFFIGSNGLAISNYHVFEKAIRGKEQVKLMNGGTYNIKEILGYDKENDYIIFRVEGSGFTYIPLTKRGYKIGDEVYAIGSPKGMANTLSNGLVSQKLDDVKFQISVPIDHGSSGGALINQYGEVIGITSGGRDDTHANLNYAIDIRVIFNDNE